jgi:hypothetical protein
MMSEANEGATMHGGWVRVTCVTVVYNLSLCIASAGEG